MAKPQFVFLRMCMVDDDDDGWMDGYDEDNVIRYTDRILFQNYDDERLVRLYVYEYVHHSSCPYSLSFLTFIDSYYHYDIIIYHFIVMLL